MPLIVPGVTPMGQSQSSTDTWTNKLLGKTLHDTKHDETNFARKELPKNHRVVEEGGMRTMDFQQDRLNVHVDKDGIVKKVTQG